MGRDGIRISIAPPQHSEDKFEGSLGIREWACSAAGTTFLSTIIVNPVDVVNFEQLPLVIVSHVPLGYMWKWDGKMMKQLLGIDVVYFIKICGDLFSIFFPSNQNNYCFLWKHLKLCCFCVRCWFASRYLETWLP